MGAGQKRVRCGECEGWTSLNCKSCKYCRDNPKYGGPGKLKKACIQWKCVKLQTKSDKKSTRKKWTWMNQVSMQAVKNKYLYKGNLRQVTYVYKTNIIRQNRVYNFKIAVSHNWLHFVLIGTHYIYINIVTLNLQIIVRYW